MWGPLPLGYDGSPAIWWVPQHQNGSVFFQVDDAMLMFDKTTNRHRGEYGPPPPFQAGLGGLWSARGLQVTAALSSLLLTSYP